MLEEREARVPSGWEPRAVLVSGAALLVAWLAGAWFLPASGALVLAALAATWYLVPRVAAFARRRGATVWPGGRSVHERPTPVLGGVAICLPLLGALVAAGGPKHLSLAVGCGLMVAAGAWDDVRGLSPTRKILFQIASAVCLFAGGFRLPALSCPGLGEFVAEASQLPLFVLWVVLVTNAINITDGIDGLAAGICLVASLACILLGYGGVVPVVLSGALLGFLRHNLPRASIFLGDAGSLMLGFVLAALVADAPGGLSLPVAFGVLALPLGELALSVVRRWLRGKPILTADRGHVHHLLLCAWGRQGRVLAGLLAFACLQALVAISFPSILGLAIEVALWAGLCCYLVRGARSRLVHLFRNRRLFKRAHVVRCYGEESLRLVGSASEVAPILEHVAHDLDLSSLRLGSIDIVRQGGGGGQLVAETLDCKGAHASWSYRRNGDDQVLDEERRDIVCQLVRSAAEVLDRFAGAQRPGFRRPEPGGPRPVFSVLRRPEPGNGTVPGTGQGRAHLIVSGPKDLLRAAQVLASCDARGAPRPLIVHTGRRDALDLEALSDEIRAAVEAGLDLDVEAQSEALQTALATHRYDALLDLEPPALTVVSGDAREAIACALAARRRGIPVASMAELLVPGCPARAARRAKGNGREPVVLGAAARGGVVQAPEARIEGGNEP